MTDESKHDLRPTLVVLVGAVLWSALALSTLRPPAARPGNAAATEFSAIRAMQTVRWLASAPRPVGSPQHQMARQALVERLEALGLEVEVQQATALEAHGDRVAAARLHNIVGRRRGHGPAGALLLVAHYDSRPNTPGAGDDASGVAVILELLRSLPQHSANQRDLLILFSDGEELGLLGARAFADQHPAMAEIAAVINFEGRGSRGLATMFETGSGNLPMVGRYTSVARHPLASSFTVEVYRRLPNDTDFTVFRRRGLPGLNFAFIEDLAAYHHALDTPERLDPRTLQHEGDSALAIVAKLLDDSDERLATSDAIYFSTGFGDWSVLYPVGWGLPLALLVSLAALAVVWHAVRREELRWPAVRWSVLVHLATCIGIPVVLWAAAKLARGLLAARLHGPHGIPADGNQWQLALVFVGLSLAVAFYSGVGEPRAAAAGGLLLWAPVGVAAAVVAPGTSFYFTWPLAAAVLGFGAALHRPRRTMLFLGLGAAPGLWLFAPLLRSLFVALTVHAAAVVGLFLALALSLLAAPLAALQRRAHWVSWSSLVGAAALWVISATGQYTKDAPRADTLFYLLDGKASIARWVSLDDQADDWTGRLLTANPTTESIELPGLRRQVQSAEAPPLPLVPPQLEVLSDEHDDSSRELSLRVHSPRGASTVLLGVETRSVILEVTVDGVTRLLDSEGNGNRPQSLSLTYAGLTDPGVEIGLRLDSYQPLELQLVDLSPGLPDVEGVTPRPPEIISTASRWTDATVVSTSSWR